MPNAKASQAPTEILALQGDAERGRQMFFSTSGAQCKSCHRVGKEGGDVGPELSQIAKKQDRAQLLESILEPSKVIEPTYSGLLVRRTAAEVVLKDAQGKVVTLPAREVEEVVPQPKSLMPELLVRDLTAQQVADLLEFLGSLR